MGVGPLRTPVQSGTHSGRVTTQRYGWRARITCGVALGGLILMLSGSTAWAGTNCTSDRRATAFPLGSPKTCSSIGLRGDTQVGSPSDQGASDADVTGIVETNEGPVQPGTGQEVDLSVTGTADVVVDAVVVAGGFRHNIYRNPNDLPPALGPDQHYIAPFNIFHAVPGINYWFTCYHLDPPGSLPDVPRVLEVPLAGGVVMAAWMVLQRRRRASSPAT
jgi:hypothetical protein